MSGAGHRHWLRALTVCALLTVGHTAEATEQCVAAKNCKAGRVCTAGKCVWLSCNVDSDCPDQLICEKASCIDPDFESGASEPKPVQPAAAQPAPVPVTKIVQIAGTTLAFDATKASSCEPCVALCRQEAEKAKLCEKGMDGGQKGAAGDACDATVDLPCRASCCPDDEVAETMLPEPAPAAIPPILEKQPAAPEKPASAGVRDACLRLVSAEKVHTLRRCSIAHGNERPSIPAAGTVLRFYSIVDGAAIVIDELGVAGSVSCDCVAPD